jgi:hypothetical protein
VKLATKLLAEENLGIEFDFQQEEELFLPFTPRLIQ